MKNSNVKAKGKTFTSFSSNWFSKNSSCMSRSSTELTICPVGVIIGNSVIRGALLPQHSLKSWKFPEVTSRKPTTIMPVVIIKTNTYHSNSMMGKSTWDFGKTQIQLMIFQIGFFEWVIDAQWIKMTLLVTCLFHFLEFYWVGQKLVSILDIKPLQSNVTFGQFPIYSVTLL